jgi:hypothetical protein
MWYAGTRTQLEGIVQWLESVNENTGDSEWGNRLDDLSECMQNLKGMAQPQQRPDKGGSSEPPQYDPHAQKYQAAIQLLEQMSMRMKLRNRGALEYGKKALVELPA